MIQIDIEEYMREHPQFDGDDYQRNRDEERLSGQMLRVFNCMKDGEWKALRVIAEETHDPEASISAQLRNLRKEKFGGYEIERRYIKDGLYEYRLVIVSYDSSKEKEEKDVLSTNFSFEKIDEDEKFYIKHWHLTVQTIDSNGEILWIDFQKEGVSKKLKNQVEKYLSEGV